VDEVGDRSGIETVTRRGDVGQEAGAGGVGGIEELAGAADRVLLAGQEMLVILRGEEGRLVMIEPPSDAGRGRVFEINDGVFVAVNSLSSKSAPARWTSP